MTSSVPTPQTITVDASEPRLLPLTVGEVGALINVLMERPMREVEPMVTRLRLVLSQRPVAPSDPTTPPDKAQ